MYDLKEAELLTGKSYNTLKTQVRRGLIPASKETRKGRSVWVINQETLDGLLGENSKFLFNDLVQTWIKNQKSGAHSGKPLSPHTVKANEEGLNRYFERLGLSKDIQNISPENFRTVLGSFISTKTTCHYSTKMKIYDGLCSFYKHLIRQKLKVREELLELREIKPVRSLPPRKTSLSAEELSWFIKVNQGVPGREYHSKFSIVLTHCIIVLAARAGLRRQEVCDLELSSIDLKARELHVIGKGKKYRLVGMKKEVNEALTRWLEKYRPQSNSNRLLLTKDGKPLVGHNIQSRIYKLAQDSGLNITMHGLRRTFATLEIERGVPVPVFQKALGHSSSKQTDEYTMISDKRSADIIKG